jgi:hypothetical protein
LQQLRESPVSLAAVVASRGSRALVGYFTVPFLVRFWALKLGANPWDITQNRQLLFFIAAVSWVTVLAFCVRFLLGRGYEKPSGIWSCPNCKYLI